MERLIAGGRDAWRIGQGIDLEAVFVVPDLLGGRKDVALVHFLKFFFAVGMIVDQRADIILYAPAYSSIRRISDLA